MSAYSGQIEEYWKDCKEKEKEIALAISKSKSQPRDGAVYIISRRNRAHGTHPGFIVLATIKLAGQKLVDETHELCTDAQIDQYLKAEAAKRELMRTDAARAKGITQFLSPPPVNEGGR